MTLRENTKRTETLHVRSNILAGNRPTDIIEATKKMALKTRTGVNPFGDGKSGKKIVDIIMQNEC